MNKKGEEYGRDFGIFVRDTRCKLLWKFSSLRNRAYWKWHNSFHIKPYSFWEGFVEAFKGWNKIPFVACDTEGCNEKGLNWHSDEHGWVYEDYYYWRCPKCSENKKEKK